MKQALIALSLILGSFFSPPASAETRIDVKKTVHFAKGEMLQVKRARDTKIQMATHRVYDLSRRGVNWSRGYTTLFIGTRKDSLDRASYRKAITHHIREVSRDFSEYGLMGYIATFDGDSEIAWQNWTSKEASERAFTSKAGQAIVRDATAFMNAVHFEETLFPRKTFPHN